MKWPLGDFLARHERRNYKEATRIQAYEGASPFCGYSTSITPFQFSWMLFQDNVAMTQMRKLRPRKVG